MGKKQLDLIGERFYRLTVLEHAGSKNGHSLWKCQCDCGKESIILGGNLKNGLSRSCGCLRSEMMVKKQTKHSMHGTPQYQVWRNMIDRCTNHKNKRFNRYGGRGISVCDKWLTFEGFYEDMGNKPRGLTLDRKNNDGNYCKDNCRWATTEEQSNNKSSNRFITYYGETHTVKQWSEKVGINYGTLLSRIRRGNCPINKLFEIAQ